MKRISREIVNANKCLLPTFFMAQTETKQSHIQMRHWRSDLNWRTNVCKANIWLHSYENIFSFLIWLNTIWIFPNHLSSVWVVPPTTWPYNWQTLLVSYVASQMWPIGVACSSATLRYCLYIVKAKVSHKTVHKEDTSLPCCWYSSLLPSAYKCDV